MRTGSYPRPDAGMSGGCLSSGALSDEMCSGTLLYVNEPRDRGELPVSPYHHPLVGARMIAAFLVPRGLSGEPTSGDAMRIPAVGAPAGTVMS